MWWWRGARRLRLHRRRARPRSSPVGAQPGFLAELAGRMAAALPGRDLAAACRWTVNSGRSGFRHRLAVTGSDAAALAAALATAAAVEVKGAPRLVVVGDDDGSWPLSPVAVMGAA